MDNEQGISNRLQQTESEVTVIANVAPTIDPVTLFRCSVLGPLISKELKRGDLKMEIQRIARYQYTFPSGERKRIGEKTLESWFYRYRRGGVDALAPKPRSDRGHSKIPTETQEALLAAKKEKPHRSIDQLILLLERRGDIAKGSLSRSSVHRLLKSNGISRPSGAASEPEEYRSFEAEFAGDIWIGDVMHGPRVLVDGEQCKTYLVSWMDDASRLLPHSAFYTGERAVDIEDALKQAILKRGIPKKIIVDNGAAYRTQSLKEIALRLGAQLIFCRPYAPEGKGKLERWHRTVRAQFLKEIDLGQVADIADLNARLWGWIEQLYHNNPHAGLGGKTPQARYLQDLPKIRTLGDASRIDEIFYHRISRKVRRDGTISYLSERFEVPYELSGKFVRLVVDPHTEQAIYVEDEKGETLGWATPLDKKANLDRKRRKPQNPEKEECSTASSMDSSTPPSTSTGENLVELAYQDHYSHTERKE
jgi:putative transposase